MGRGDEHFLDDEQDDAALRRLLGAPEARWVDPPPDLAARTLRRLPPARPRAAARRMATRRALRFAAGSGALVTLVLPAVLGGAALSAGDASLALRLPSAPTSAVTLPPGAISPFSPIGRLLIGLLLWVALLALGALVTGAWPRRTAIAARALNAAPLRALAWGLPLLAGLALLVVPLTLLLAATPVGLLPAALLVTLAQAPLLAGAAVLARAVAPRLTGRGDPPAALDAATLGVVALISLPAAIAATAGPWWAAPLLIYLPALPGLGALVLSRAGTLAPARAS